MATLLYNVVLQLTNDFVIGGDLGGSYGAEGGVRQGDPHHPLQLCSANQESGDMIKGFST